MSSARDLCTTHESVHDAYDSCGAVCHDCKRIQAALDEAREAGRREERERCCQVLQGKADANIRAAALKEADGNHASAESHELSSTWMGEAIEEIRAQWAITAIRAAEPEEDPDCSLGVDCKQYGPRSNCPGCPKPGDETTVGKAAKPEPLYTFTADGSKGSPTPPWFEEACKRGDVFARSDDRDIASIPLVNQLAKPEPCICPQPAWSSRLCMAQMHTPAKTTWQKMRTLTWKDWGSVALFLALPVTAPLAILGVALAAIGVAMLTPWSNAAGTKFVRWLLIPGSTIGSIYGEGVAKMFTPRGHREPPSEGSDDAE